MAEVAKGTKQIQVPTKTKDAPVKKMGQTVGSKYGMNPSKRDK